MPDHRTTCGRCGGTLLSVLTQVDYPFEGRSYPLENVPVELCRACGAKYILEGNRRRLDAILARLLRQQEIHRPLSAASTRPKRRR